MTPHCSVEGGRRATVIGLLFMLAGAPRAADAQTYPRGRSFEVGGDAVWIGGSAVGAAKATETRNQAGSSDRLTLFEADGRLKSVAGIGARIGLNLTSNFGIEAALTYSRPLIVTSISNDFEGAPSATIGTSPLIQYLADLGVILHMTHLRFSRGSVPFATASVGYLRQLTVDPAVAETGRVYQIGGGLKQMLSAGRGLGLRVDARLGVRDGGFAFAGPSRRPFFVASAGLFAAF